MVSGVMDGNSVLQAAMRIRVEGVELTRQGLPNPDINRQIWSVNTRQGDTFHLLRRGCVFNSTSGNLSCAGPRDHMGISGWRWSSFVDSAADCLWRTGMALEHLGQRNFKVNTAGARAWRRERNWFQNLSVPSHMPPGLPMRSLVY